MEFGELSTEIQIIAASTLKDILVSGIYDGYEQSATDAAIHVRTAFEVLFGKETAVEGIKMDITIDGHLGKFGDALAQVFSVGSVTVHRG